MKNRHHLILSCLLLVSFSFLVSCGNEDEGPAIAPIVGAWSYNDLDLEIQVNNQPFTSFLIENLNYTAPQAAAAEAFYKGLVAESIDFENTVVNFKADGTYDLTSPDYQESGTYRLANGDTKLILTSGSEETEYDVEELTNNRLRFSFTETGQEDLTDDGTDENIEVKFSLVFVK